MTESRFPVTTLEFEISFLQGSFTVLVKLSFWWTVPPLFFSLLFFVNLVITDKRENVNNKIRKI